MHAFLSRPLQEAGYACVHLDPTSLKGRLSRALQICARAVVIMGVNADSKSEASWPAFITSRKERGLAVAWRVASDAVERLNKVMAQEAVRMCVEALQRLSRS